MKVEAPVDWLLTLAIKKKLLDVASSIIVDLNAKTVATKCQAAKVCTAKED